MTWLQSGGRWRATTTVCGRCGAAAPYTTGWLSPAGSERPWTLPGRLIRAGWRTLARRRTTEPHPWLYVASAGAGAVMGGGAAIATRSGRLPLGVLTGSGAGLVICWSVFAQTAMRAPGLGTDMWTALLQEAAPERALRRRLDEDDRISRTAAFPVYGLSEAWTGSRQLAGYSLSGAPGRQRTVNSLVVAHGDLRTNRLWLAVETTMRNGGYRSFDLDWVEHSLARHLRGELERPPEDASPEEEARWWRAREQARAADPDLAWTDTVLTVEGTEVPARWLGQGERWVAHMAVDGARVVVRAHDVPVERVDLVRVELSAYAPAG